MHIPHVEGIWKIKETYVYVDYNGNDNFCSPGHVETKWKISQNKRFIKMECLDNDYKPIIGVWDNEKDKNGNFLRWKLRLANIGDNGTVNISPSKINNHNIKEMTYTMLRAGFVKSSHKSGEPTVAHGVIEKIN
jgi:hypothetical protein